MFNDKLKEEIKEIKEVLVGVALSYNSFDTPASYSALAKLESINKRMYHQEAMMRMLIDELGFAYENGARLVKKKKAKK